MKLSYQHAGPARPESIELPPKAPWIGDYVLAYDPGRKQTIYFYSHEFHQLGHAAAFDGRRWAPISETAIRTESPKQRWQGFHDPSRGGVVGWNFTRDDEYQLVVLGVLLKDDEPVVLETSGERPTLDDEAGDVGALFAFDPVRSRTVCLTQTALFELDERGVWTQHAVEGVPTSDWRDECFGATWDPVAERVVFYLVAEDANEDDRLWHFEWDGRALTLLDDEGLPDLVTGWMTTGPLVCGHPVHGRVLLSKRGVFRWDGGWVALEGEAPPGTCEAKVCFDGSLGAFFLGPGRYEPEPDAYPKEQVIFYVGTEAGWTKQGVTEAKSAVGELWSKRFGAFVGGTWLHLGNFYLHTVAWTDEGWVERVGKKQQAELWDGGRGKKHSHVLLDLVDVEGTPTLVSNEGHVFELEDEWKLVGGPSDELKHRMWAQLAYDAANRRLVVFGGEVRGRRTAHTLVFALDHGAKHARTWKKLSKKSPKPLAHGRKKGDRDVTMQLFYDTARKQVTRVGFEEIARLDGDVWVPSQPEGLAELNDLDYRAICHDPESGRTLILSFRTGVLFELGDRCTKVAEVPLPELRLPSHIDENHAHRALCEDWAFDPETKALHVQNPDDQYGHYVLSLAEVFKR